MNHFHDLSTLFDPRAIAVVGATEKAGRVGRIIFENLGRCGRPLYPVHPVERTVFGCDVYETPGDLPSDVDLAVIAIGAEKAVEAARECAAHGIPNLVVVAGGFSESSEHGRELEHQLTDLRGSHGTRILGPNSLGIFVPASGIDTIFVEHGDRVLSGGGGVAFVTQSGSVGVEALGVASNTGYGLRAFVGLGNKCDLNELDFLEYFATDPETSCLAFYVESLDTGRRFLDVARRVSAEKPIVVLKAGRTAAGAHAVNSHTGRLAGSDKVVDGAFRQYGIQRVFDDEELCDASKTLSMLSCPSGNRVAIITPAGGYGVMGADHVETRRGHVELQMARLSAETQLRIREATLPFAAVQNPVDLTASASDEMFGAALDAVLDDDGVDIVLCTAFFAPPAITDALVDEVASRRARTHKPIIAFTQYGPFTDSYLRRFHEAGVVGFPSISRAVRAARFLVERARITEALRGDR